jgi:hypothetical protein
MTSADSSSSTGISSRPRYAAGEAAQGGIGLTLADAHPDACEFLPFGAGDVDAEHDHSKAWLSA